MPRTYVDNAYNRSVGRVGMAHGTAVISSRSSGYTSNNSSYSYTPQTSYVDNSMNRSLGRVGLPHGSAVHSRSNSGISESSGYPSNNSSYSYTPQTYVDNSMNRSLGRVGLPHGTAVHSKSNSAAYSTSTSCYVDNELNRRLGRVGLEKGSCVYSKSERSLDRNLGRAQISTGVLSMTPLQVQDTHRKTYVDNALNRRLNRVGKPLGTAIYSKAIQRPAFDFNQNNCENYQRVPLMTLFDDIVLEEIELLKNLRQARSKSKIRREGDALKLKPEHVILFDDLALGDKIGCGGFGDVHVALWKSNQVAVKKLRVQRVSEIRKKQFQDEVRSIAQLDHRCIVKFYGACIVPPNLAIVMEFLPDGSLYDNLYYSDSVQFNDRTKNQFISDTFSALSYIHSKNMVHRDIKSKNIMLCDSRTHCKLADFGLMLKDETETNASQRQHGFAGTEKYCPKEVIEGQRLTVEQLKCVDVYSLGLTMVELLTELEPFEGLNIYQIRKAITNGESPKIHGFGILRDIKVLLKKALSVDVTKRPTAASFLSEFNAIQKTKGNVSTPLRDSVFHFSGTGFK